MAGGYGAAHLVSGFVTSDGAASPVAPIADLPHPTTYGCMAIPPGEGAQAAKAYLVGGGDGGDGTQCVGDIYEYDLETNAWTLLANDREICKVRGFYELSN